MDDANEFVEQFGQYDPMLDLSGYRYPNLDLLHLSSSQVSLTAKTVDALTFNDIQVEQIKATVGPTLTLYELPARGSRRSKV